MIQTTRPEEGASSLSSASPVSANSESSFRGWILLWSSFGFALLQSACTFFIAISGLRLLIGISSLAFAAAGLHLVDRLHVDLIRIPMVLLAWPAPSSTCMRFAEPAASGTVPPRDGAHSPSPRKSSAPKDFRFFSPWRPSSYLQSRKPLISPSITSCSFGACRVRSLQGRKFFL